MLLLTSQGVCPPVSKESGDMNPHPLQLGNCDTVNCDNDTLDSILAESLFYRILNFIKKDVIAFANNRNDAVSFGTPIIIEHLVFTIT